MTKNSGIGRFAYSNPSAEFSDNQVTGSVDAGVTCRVENLPRELCLPVTDGSDRNGAMRTHKSVPGDGEEGVRFLLDTEEEPVVLRPLTIPPAHRGYPALSQGMPRSPSSFASFDELFHGVKDYQYPLPPAYRQSESVDNGFYSDESPDMQVGKYLTQEESVHSRMSKNSLRHLVRESWQSTTNFRSFRRRLGPHLNEKYCMKLKIHATIFMFLHVVYGAAMLSVATFAWNLKSVDSILGGYLVANGVLSVFLFPILFMEWGPRIGGCIEERAPVQTVCYFALSLVLRVCACVTGSVCVYYRYPVYIGPTADPEFVQYQWGLLFVASSVCLDWFILLVSIVIPTCCCCGCYYCAGTKLCAPVKKKTLLSEKQAVMIE